MIIFQSPSADSDLFMQPYDRFWLFGISVLIAGVALLTGCDNSVDAFEEDAGLFSIHGYLSLSGNEHFIRVKDLNEPLVGDSTRAIDATVTLENLTTGQVETLTDSIVAFEGVYTHNFRTDQDIQPATRYRVSVERPDGRTARATATMPPRTEVALDPEEPTDCTEALVVRFRNVQEVRLLRVSVGFVWRNQLNWVDLDEPTVGSEGTPVFSFAPATILDGVFPTSLKRNLGFDQERYCNQLNEDDFRVAYTRFGPDWPADSVLTDPLASSVENGIGVFGGLQRDTLTQRVE